MLRPIGGQEASNTNTLLLKIASVTGVVLVAADGLSSLDEARTLARRLSVLGGLFAGLGLVQFSTGMLLTNYIMLPGFASGQTNPTVAERSDFFRAAATAIHPLEYATVLSMTLPIALNLAIADTRTRAPVSRWWPVVTIGLASVLSVSRSALIGFAVALLLVFPGWPAPAKKGALAALPFGVAGLFVAVPGMIGTIRGLFIGVSSNSSTQSRTGSFDVVQEFFERRPILGRGFGTFLPNYHVVDDQYLILIIEGGLVGLLTFLGLIVSTVVRTRRTARMIASVRDRALLEAFAASLAVGAVLFGFFDAFSFPKAIDCLFLLVGLCSVASDRMSVR